ncbi:MAG: hypothetical protein ACYSX0_02940 [Planctomycetota bacterium]|jgi:septin family protein
MRREDLTPKQKVIATCVSAVLIICGVLLFPGPSGPTAPRHESPKGKHKSREVVPTVNPEPHGSDEERLQMHREAMQANERIAQESRARTEEARRRAEEWRREFEEKRRRSAEESEQRRAEFEEKREAMKARMEEMRAHMQADRRDRERKE